MTLTNRLAAALLLAGAAANAPAQITLDDAYLPRVGDAAVTYVQEGYTDPAGNLARDGGNQTWVFAPAARDRTINTAVSAAREGSAAADFPDADLTVRSRSQLGGFDTETELYLRRSERGLELLGLAAADTSEGLPALRLSKPLLYAPAQLAFGTSVADASSSRFTFGSEVLTALTGDPSYAQLVDSVGLRIDQTATFEVDSWGTVNVLDAGRVSALRVKRTTGVRQALEVKAGPFGWIDITALGLVPDSLLPPARLNVVDYSFLTAGRRAPAYVIRVDSLGQPASLEYAANVVGTAELAREDSALKAYLRGDQLTVVAGPPRPRSSDRVAIYGADGRQLASERLAEGQTELSLGTASWPAGVHLVTLWRDGTLAATQRVLVIR